ncbi:MAG: RNA-binding protein [Eubacteriales bacterium]
MSDISKGMVAKSLAGHDKDSIYLIVKVENGYAYLLDGHTKKTENPKKKKIKHIQIIKKTSFRINLNNIEEMRDEEIKKIIKQYKKELSI